MDAERDLEHAEQYIEDLATDVMLAIASLTLGNVEDGGDMILNALARATTYHRLDCEGGDDCTPFRDEGIAGCGCTCHQEHERPQIRAVAVDDCYRC